MFLGAPDRHSAPVEVCRAPWAKGLQLHYFHHAQGCLWWAALPGHRCLTKTLCIYFLILGKPTYVHVSKTCYFAILRWITAMCETLRSHWKGVGWLREETVPLAQANSKAPSNTADTGWSPPSRRQSAPFCSAKSLSTSNSHTLSVVTTSKAM